MSKPQYANVFTCSFTPATKELVIEFSQTFPIFTHSSQPTEGKVGTTANGSIETVSSVVLSESVARQLLDSLHQVLNHSDSDHQAG